MEGVNHPFVVFAVFYLWLISVFAVAWSLMLFFCIGDILSLTGTDLVNAVVLLSGIIMIPPNMHMLCYIANNRKIDYKAKVACCPLWLTIIWIIIVNILGVYLCICKICSAHDTTNKVLQNCMKQYRSIPKYKHFMDNLQWSLKCCGLNSYRDWFTRDWYDKTRDYEWDPSASKRISRSDKEVSETDSVPLSCCKSGSCISNYLSELGTHSINTPGCRHQLHRLVVISMVAHLIIFSSMIIVEILILKLIMKKNKPNSSNLFGCSDTIFNVKQIMKARDNFDVSSGSYEINPEDSEYAEDVELLEVQVPDQDKSSQAIQEGRITLYDKVESK